MATILMKSLFTASELCPEGRFSLPPQSQRAVIGNVGRNSKRISTFDSKTLTLNRSIPRFCAYEASDELVEKSLMQFFDAKKKKILGCALFYMSQNSPYLMIDFM